MDHKINIDQLGDEPLEVIDRSFMLKDLQIGASFVPMLQNVLLHILSSWDGMRITKAYQNMDATTKLLEENMEEYKKDPSKMPQYTHDEQIIYTLVTLIEYLKGQAVHQGAMHKVDKLTIDDMKPAIEAFSKGDMEAFEKETRGIDKILGERFADQANED